MTDLLLSRARRFRPAMILVVVGALAACGDSATGPGGSAVTLDAAGLPEGVAATVEVNGPNGFTRTVSLPGTLSAPPGNYGLRPNNVTVGGQAFAAPGRMLSITGIPANVTLQYRPAGTLNLRIEALTITQSVQTLSNAVPLIRGRDAMLRVFVTANEQNDARPPVRVRLLNGTTELHSVTIPATASAVPMSVQEDAMAASWNAVIPASAIQPGISIVAEVDPENAILESETRDNRFPETGANPLDVRSVPPLMLRFVPVLQSANGLQGDISQANVDQFLSSTRRMMPLGNIDVEMRAPYTTTAGAVTGANDNNAWGTILNEVRALRTADGSTRHYYGVLKTSYNSGVAGIGYVGFPTSLGWDRLPSASDVMAHELGHNWGRLHAPCGGPSGLDVAYPYAEGETGAYGYDMTSAQLRNPSSKDIMGYCSSKWISDYTYTGIMNFRSGTAAAMASVQGESPALLVWGRIVNGRVELEPAFSVTTQPALPTGTGPYRIEGLDANGVSLFSLPFDAERIADIPGNERHFAFALPMGTTEMERLATLRVGGTSGTVQSAQVTTPSAAAMRAGRAPVGAAAPGRAPAARRLAGDRVSVTWDATSHPMALVRDARSGRILSFARGGSATVYTGAANVELVLSDRVRSRSERVSVR